MGVGKVYAAGSQSIHVRRVDLAIVAIEKTGPIPHVVDG